MPSEQSTERKGKKMVKVTKKFFPGYIFVHMDISNKAAWSLVKNTPKVSGFLGGQTPRPVPQREIDKMLGTALPEVAVAVEEELPSITYAVGEHVRVKAGAFANFAGEVEEVNLDKRKIWLSVSLFGRPTRVEVDFSEVEHAPLP